MPKRLRSGYTTGACAAAATKAAALCIVTKNAPESVEIPFPDGNRVSFNVHHVKKISASSASASIIKDAGDDPDVTNRAEITATVAIVAGASVEKNAPTTIVIEGGAGVGRVTKRGLSVDVGEAAINPVPRQMINAAAREALDGFRQIETLTVTISVPDGERLAQKTLNKRLGILGGISILGTTGIVHPVSAAAWTATITASMDVALASGVEEIVISTGRTSERAVQNMLTLPEEALAMMGDYLEFSLLEAKHHNFKKIHLAGMWAKIMKAAMEIPQTHVRHGALEITNALELLLDLGADQTLVDDLADCNTAREIYVRLVEHGRQDLVRLVCLKAQDYASNVSGLPVHVYLIHNNQEIVEHV